MKPDALTKVLLAIIAALLFARLLQPVISPAPARAAAADAQSLYIEPGTTMISSPDGDRTVVGKVIVDLNNGNVWGFPTIASVPYPRDTTRTTPPTSHPIYLGKFDLAAIRGSAQ